MKRTVLYVHGKGGSADEADRYKALFPDCDVVGSDYRGEMPWEVKEELLSEYRRLAARSDRLIVIANSIGAYFVMNALSGERIERAFFISPVVDMEKLITAMMDAAGVDEEELKTKKEIETPFGERLSLNYLRYVREHPLVWTVPTEILYGEKDALISLETVSSFTKKHDAALTVMKNGEHWFHTEEQMAFLDGWIRERMVKNAKRG